MSKFDLESAGAPTDDARYDTPIYDAFPDPEDLASLQPDDLKRHGFSSIKGRTIIETAQAVVAELEGELGISLDQETMDFDSYFRRLDTEPPQIWFLSWVADYPGRNDFLGVLLGSRSSNNYGRWSSPEFDAAIADAGSTTDEAAARAAFDRAEEVVKRDVPVIPMSYGTGWALAKEGLVGTGQNGLGAMRFAGLAWAP